VRLNALGHNVMTGIDQAIPASTSAAFATPAALPVYTSGEAMTGSAILLALCLIGLVTVAVARWRRR
jgi:hypothetical protein